jgi:hypothetical protein
LQPTAARCDAGSAPTGGLNVRDRALFLRGAFGARKFTAHMLGDNRRRFCGVERLGFE